MSLVPAGSSAVGEGQDVFQSVQTAVASQLNSQRGGQGSLITPESIGHIALGASHVANQSVLVLILLNDFPFDLQVLGSTPVCEGLPNVVLIAVLEVEAVRRVGNQNLQGQLFRDLHSSGTLGLSTGGASGLTSGGASGLGFCGSTACENANSHDGNQQQSKYSHNVLCVHFYIPPVFLLYTGDLPVVYSNDLREHPPGR